MSIYYSLPVYKPVRRLFNCNIYIGSMWLLNSYFQLVKGVLSIFMSGNLEEMISVASFWDCSNNQVVAVVYSLNSWEKSLKQSWQ